MTGDELKQIRLSLGLSLSQMGRELGYTGSVLVLKASVWRLENKRNVPFERAYRAMQLKEQRQ